MRYQLPTLRLQRAALLSATLLSSLLTACGGDEGPVDPLATYKAQALAWAPCDPDILGNGAQSTIRALGERLQCAQMRTPMNWSQPEQGDISVALMRLRSSNSEQRRASLILNPGGPGLDGLEQSLSLFRALRNSNPADAVGALQLQLLERYDMVGFSPRGTGSSTQLTCSSTAQEQYVDLSPRASALTDATLDAALYNLQKNSEACASNPLTPYINSDATARDMDLMRHLLGDEKLHYLGYSYGTWLGAWYAGLFPEKVGRMVLDSSVDFTATLDGLGMTQAVARLQDEVMLPYAARHPEIANLGTDVQALQSMTATLDPQLEYALGVRLSNQGYYRNTTELYPLTWLAARELQRLLPGPLPRDTPPDWDLLDEALDNHRLASNAQADALARAEAETLIAIMANNHPSRPRKPIELAASNATGLAVRCNDAPGVTDILLWKADIRTLAQQAPLHYMIGEIMRCTYWGGPSVQKPALDKLKPLDLLMVQSEYDTATATPGALRFFGQLDQARMVYVPEEHHHGLFPYAVQTTRDALKCVNRTVTLYLLGTSPSERTTTCQAEPKVWDAMTTKSSEPAGATAAFLHLEETEALLRQFRQGLQP